MLALAAFVFGTAPVANAVTQQEMDQARAIAAKFYVRYADNLSGYLDDYSPASMSELEGKLTTDKDKEILNQFKKAGSPSDYASWDKEKLINYWSGTFFTENLSRLDANAANNGQCKIKIKEAISALTISAPAGAAPETQQPADQGSLSEMIADSPGALDAANKQQDFSSIDGQIEETQDSIAEEEALPAEKKQKSGTWVYIMILAILVVVVIFLVAYASKTMKGQTKAPKANAKRREEDFAPMAAPARLNDDTRMREKYAESLASKAEEIRSLTRQISELEMLNTDLKDENIRLKREIDRLNKRYSEEFMAPTPAPAPVPAPRSAYEPEPSRPEREEEKESESVGEIFLGRVNTKGIFVRADRRPVDGQSVYELSSVNGTSGLFSIIKNPKVEARLLAEPGKWLSGGCFAKDIFDTEGRTNIFTEVPGEAVFADGAWRVERKARISYM